MSRISLSHLLILFSGLAFIGCNRGCTTQSTIKSESITVSTKGGNAEIIGRVIDYRHSTRVGSNIFERSVSHTYGLCFDIKFGTFEQQNFYDEGVDNPDNVDLGTELKRVKVVISDDQNHIGLGVDGKVVDIIHLYKSNRIFTMDEKLKTDGTMDWSKLDINSYPSPQKILTESLKNSCEHMVSSDALFEYCNSSKPSAKIHEVMLKKWPSCKTAKDYLTDQKVRELAKSKKWRKEAEKRAKKIVKNIERYDSDLKTIKEFIVALDSKDLVERYDEELTKRWGQSGVTDYTKLLVERIEDQKMPMSKDMRKAVYESAFEEFTKFQEKGESNYKREATDCLELLNALGDTTVAYNFIQDAFGPNVKKFDRSDFLNVAFGEFGSYTDHQQELMLKKTEKTFEYFKDYERSIFYRAIEDLVDCSMLKRLKTQYPEDLKMNNIPSRCGP